MYMLIKTKKHYLKYLTHCKTINRNYLHQCKTNKALLHLDSLQKLHVQNTLSSTAVTKTYSLLNILFLKEAIALCSITTTGSISLTINSADMLVRCSRPTSILQILLQTTFNRSYSHQKTYTITYHNKYLTTKS